jgi:hypothetical protein
MIGMSQGTEMPLTRTYHGSPLKALSTKLPCISQMGHVLFVAESFGGWDGDGVAGGQQAGEECAESEERGGCE